MRGRRAVIVGLAAGLAIVVAFEAGERIAQDRRNRPIVGEQIRKALAAEQWHQVLALLNDVDEGAGRPVLQFVKAHACLALNRNNDSVALFSSAGTPQGVSQWWDWTDWFARKNKRSPAAHYLRGDALARLQQWDAALKAFDTALKLNPEHNLSLNARGLVHAAAGRYNEALVDLHKAAESGPPLADAWSNIGALSIARQDAPEGGLKAFNKALQIAPDNCLALIGRAGLYIVLGQFDKALKDLHSAGPSVHEAPSVLGLVFAGNLRAFEKASTLACKEYLEKRLGWRPGMDISAIAESRSLGERIDAYRAAKNNVAWLGLVEDLWSCVPDRIQVKGGIGLQGVWAGVEVGWGREPAAGKDRIAWGRVAATLGGSLRSDGVDLRTLKPMSPRESYQASRPGSFTRDLFEAARAGGVSSAEIATAPRDTGHWEVCCAYGLLYPVHGTSGANLNAMGG